MRILVTAGSRRMSALPEVPTLAEAVLGGPVVTSGSSVVGPAGLPAQAVAKLHAAFAVAMRDPSLMTSIAAEGGDVTLSQSPAAYAAAWPEELPREEVANGAIFQAGYDVALFENVVAHRVGDTVTINLMESTAAQKSSSTSTDKSTSVDISAPVFGGAPLTIKGNEISAGLENSRKFEGSGDSSQSNKLSGNVTVTVARRLANGFSGRIGCR